jgi:hypothetical protein
MASSAEDVTLPAEQEKQVEEEALESHEVIELQAFSEKKPWIEERIRVSLIALFSILVLNLPQFLEEMPPIEVFVGLDAIRAFAEVVPGLPSRAVLEEWLSKHDSVDKEMEVFDIVELEKLRKLTKGERIRTNCLVTHSPLSKLLPTEICLRRILTLLNRLSLPFSPSTNCYSYCMSARKPLSFLELG